MFMYKVDYVDFYFQFIKSEGWSLEEGIVKIGSFFIDQGVGVCVVLGDKIVFFYLDEIFELVLLDVVVVICIIVCQGSGKIKVVGVMMLVGGCVLYLLYDLLILLDVIVKVQLLECIECIVCVKDLCVKQVMVSFFGEYDVVLVVCVDGVLVVDICLLVWVLVMVIVEQNGCCEMGSSGGGG